MADPEHGSGIQSGDLHRRLEALSNALDANSGKTERQKAAQKAADASAGSLGAAMNLGFRVLTEFAAAVVVAALIGWQIDAWVRTSPLFLIIFLALGTASGFWNVYRIAAKPTRK